MRLSVARPQVVDEQPLGVRRLSRAEGDRGGEPEE